MRVTRIVKMQKTEDIGLADHAIRLPMEGRLRRGQKTVCVLCRKDVTDAHFIAAFKKGHPNMIFHEACFDGEVAPPR